MPNHVNPQWVIDRHPNDLKAQIRYLVGKGYQVAHQEGDSVQLLKKKSFSCLFCLLLGFFPYIIWYLAKRDRIIFLDFTDQKPTPISQRSEFKNSMGEFYESLGVGGVIAVLFGGLVLVIMVSSFVRAQLDTISEPAITATTTEAVLKEVAKPIFDLPSLATKNIDQVRRTLGMPNNDEPTKQQLGLGATEWSNNFTKGEYELLITYNPVNRKIVDFFISKTIVESEKKALMSIGGVKENDPRYDVEFVAALRGDRIYTGMKVTPKR